MNSMIADETILQIAVMFNNYLLVNACEINVQFLFGLMPSVQPIVVNSIVQLVTETRCPFVQNSCPNQS